MDSHLARTDWNYLLRLGFLDIQRAVVLLGENLLEFLQETFTKLVALNLSDSSAKLKFCRLVTQKKLV